MNEVELAPDGEVSSLLSPVEPGTLAEEMGDQMNVSAHTMQSNLKQETSLQD